MAIEHRVIKSFWLSKDNKQPLSEEFVPIPLSLSLSSTDVQLP